YMFVALHNLRSDRATTFRDLATDKEFPQMTQRVIDARKAEMPALRSALTVIEGLDFPERQTMATALRQSVDRLAALHKETETALGQPKSARRPGLGQEFFKEVNEALALIEKLSTQLSRSIKLEDAFIDQLMEVKYLAWVARNAGGDASVMISNGIGGQP